MRSARSRIPESPQCPSRPERSTLVVNAAAVVADEDAHVAGRVADFDLDFLRARVANRVGQRLAADHDRPRRG